MLTLKDLRVEDVMTPSPNLLPAGASLAEAVSFLQEHELQGAPVVDEEGKLVTVVSTSDLLREVAAAFAEPAVSEGAVESLGRRALRSVAFEEPATCDKGLSLADACKQMIRRRVHRLVVVEGEKPVGIVSAIDAVRTVACLDDMPILPPEELEENQ